MAIMAGPVMRFNTMACVDRMIDIAKAMAGTVQPSRWPEKRPV
jgi:hypothetical protein